LEIFRTKRHYPLKPTSEFHLGDAREFLQSIETLDVRYYTGDSEGDGGSGIFIPGDRVLEWLVPKMAPTGLSPMAPTVEAVTLNGWFVLLVWISMVAIFHCWKSWWMD
jgi:hypothetical protein